MIHTTHIVCDIQVQNEYRSAVCVCVNRIVHGEYHSIFDYFDTFMALKMLFHDISTP